MLMDLSRILKHAGDLGAAAAFADEARCMDLADRYVAVAEKLLYYSQKMGINTTTFMTCSACGMSLPPVKVFSARVNFMLPFVGIRNTVCIVMLVGVGGLYIAGFCTRIGVKKSPSLEAEEKNEELSASGVSRSGKRHVKPVDPDPHGEKLCRLNFTAFSDHWNSYLAVEDPLSEATKYLKLLQKNSPDSLETHLLSFELYTRKQKILLAFQAVKQLLRLDPEHPDSHRCLIKFFHQVGSMNAPVTDSEKLIWSVLEAERSTISQLHEKSLFEANNSFLEKHKDSLMHRAAFAEILYILDSSRKSDAVKWIEESTNNIVPGNLRAFWNSSSHPTGGETFRAILISFIGMEHSDQSGNGNLQTVLQSQASWNGKEDKDEYCFAEHLVINFATILGYGDGQCVVQSTSLIQRTLREAAALPLRTRPSNQLRKNSENESPNHSICKFGCMVNRTAFDTPRNDCVAVCSSKGQSFGAGYGKFYATTPMYFFERLLPPDCEMYSVCKCV
ncbi:N-terminal acetyltransferase A, auxiliary subunit [Sesbania bispinosa]|nr:N-terminal acetyltransferase A, auxiliary subunit [Sesbania bispinosa]